MRTSWTAVWQIAARRHDTKQGRDHMTDHGHEVLEKLAMREAAEAMSSAHGRLSFFYFSP
jgi:hypothetical protein